MFIGHASPSFLAKPYLPDTSLGALLFATAIPDAVAFTFAAVGVETFRFNPKKLGALPYDFLMPYTHSMVGMLAMGLLYALAYTVVLRHEQFSGNMLKKVVVIVGLTLSHWFLEVPVHRNWLDGVTIFFNDPRKFGWGLFEYQLLEVGLELALFLPAVAFYAAFTRAKVEETALPWYARLDGFTAFCVVTQFLVCGAPRLVYEKVPDRLMAVNAVLIIFSHAYMAYMVDGNRVVLPKPEVQVPAAISKKAA